MRGKKSPIASSHRGGSPAAPSEMKTLDTKPRGMRVALVMDWAAPMVLARAETATPAVAKAAEPTTKARTMAGSLAASMFTP